MEQLLGQDFDGILEYIAQDAEGNIGIRMQCTQKTLLYFDENDDKYERKENEPMNKKVFFTIHQGQLEWGDPLLCMPGDDISIRRWMSEEERKKESTLTDWLYGITNETLDSSDSEYEWLGSL